MSTTQTETSNDVTPVVAVAAPAGKKSEICKAWIVANVVAMGLQNNMTKAHETFNAERTEKSLPEFSKGVFREQFNIVFPNRTINTKTVSCAEYIAANPDVLNHPKGQGYTKFIKTLPGDESVAPNVFNRAYDAAKALQVAAELKAKEEAPIAEPAIVAEVASEPETVIPAGKKNKKK